MVGGSFALDWAQDKQLVNARDQNQGWGARVTPPLLLLGYRQGWQSPFTSNQATTRFCGSLRSICSSSLSLAVVDITTGGVPEGSTAPATAI